MEDKRFSSETANVDVDGPLGPRQHTAIYNSEVRWDTFETLAATHLGSQINTLLVPQNVVLSGHFNPHHAGTNGESPSYAIPSA